MEVYENPRKRRARGKRRSKRRSSWFGKMLASKRPSRRRSKRRRNPFSLRRGGGGGGGGRGIGTAFRSALPAVGGFWLADFASKFVSDRVAFIGSQRYGRQLFAGLAGVLLLLVGRRVPMSRPLAVGMIGWGAWSGLARAGFSGFEIASRMRSGLSGDDDLDGLGTPGMPQFLGEQPPGNLLGLGEPQAMLFGLGAVDDTYGGRA